MRRDLVTSKDIIFRQAKLPISCARVASLAEAWQLETCTAPIHYVLVSLYLRTLHSVSQQQQQQHREEEHGKRKSKAQKFEKSGKQQRQTIEGERQRERERDKEKEGQS